MKVLVIGSGGREHALVWKISRSAKVGKLFCAPGNPGIAELAECLPIRATAIDGLLNVAKTERIDLTVVGPEQPLAEGIVDVFEANGLKIFGPTKRAAELEWSKVFAKEFMHRHAIPTAEHHTFGQSEIEGAKRLIAKSHLPLVVKADGLAAGKGVVICSTIEQALQAADEMKEQFGFASNKVIVEEFMEGEEASIFAICDGRDFITLTTAQDHKRVFDGDRGKNTGGMGAYAPAPIVTEDIMREVEERIIIPTLSGMAEEGRPYKGCLYVGVMITSDGPKVVEYNCRFGDPETQVILPLYGGDVIELFDAACTESIATLRERHVGNSNKQTAVCVVLASEGYPDEYTTGIEITGVDEVQPLNDVMVFHAGTKEVNGELHTSGGRVLGITAVNADLARAIENAYGAVNKISFAGMHYRRDIGKKAFVH